MISRDVIVAWGRAHWHWIAGALVGVLLALGFWYYGHTQYDHGRDLARADIADSISKVYDRRFTSFRDSVQTQVDAFNAGMARANARADSADARALRVQQLAATTLTPQVIARTPPEVLALVLAQRAALDSNTVALKDIRTRLDTATAIIARQHEALVLADTAIVQQQRTIKTLQDVKDPPHGFWHTVGVVAKYTGAVVTGVGLGIAIAH